MDATIVPEIEAAKKERAVSGEIMLLNSASDELCETFGFVGKLHSIILKSAGLARVILACCAGQTMAAGDAAETIEAAYKQIQP